MERLRRVSDNADGGLTRCSRDWFYLSANPAYAKIVGKALDQIVGRPIVEVMGAKAAETIRPYIERVLRGEHVIYETEVEFSHAGQRYLNVSYTPDTDATGQTVGWVACVTDITERKRIEVSLRARARQQRVVAELGELALKERDLFAVFDRATTAIVETLDVEYSKVLELLPGGDAVALRAGRGWREGLVGNATVSTGLNSQAGYTLLSDKPVVVADLRTDTRFNGPPLLIDHGVVSGMSCLIRRTDGAPWGVLGAHSTRRLDFTEDDVSFLAAVANILGDAIHRNYAEQKLRISERRFRAFFESGLIGVISWNIDGSITDANDAFLEMLGYTRDDVEARRLSWRQITPPEFDEVDRIAAENIIAAGVTPPFEKEYFRKDGSRLPILLAAATLDESRQEGVGFVLDISERKQHEARLQKLNAERLNCMRTMTASLAHEINQPLAATAAYLTTIKRLLDRAPEQRKISVPETLDKASSQVARAGQILAHLRNFVANGEPDKLFVHLHEIIREVCKATVSATEDKGMRVALRLQASDDKALADPVQVRQVLENLIRNAKEAMRDSMRQELTISTSSTLSEIRVDVADTGSGLSENVRLSLFQPFTTTKSTGMGIGLAISRTIIEAHHGEISFAERPEGGVVFSCTLPLASSLIEG